MIINSKISFLSKCLGLFLAVVVLLPSTVKLLHAFNHHEHTVCLNDGVDRDTHFHETDIECEFYKFKLNNDIYFNASELEESEDVEINRTVLTYYTFQKSHQQDTSSQRGPPALV